MRFNARALMVHLCDIQRPKVLSSISTIRDRQVSYDTKTTDNPCWFEPTGTSYDFNDQIGQIAIKNFNVHFNGSTDVKEGDRLKKGSDFYLVRGVQDNSDQGFHVVCQVELKNYAMV